MIRKPATLKDIAKLVGVHTSTVSRALSPKTSGRITGELAEKINKVAKKLNYNTNSIAYSLRTKRSMAIGVVIPDITNSVFPPIVRGIEDIFSSRRYIAYIVNTDGDAKKEANLVSTLNIRGVDGLILASSLLKSRLIDQIMSMGIPAVTVNRIVEDQNISSVTNDDRSGIEQAVSHVYGLGHRHVAHITGPMDSSTGRTRHDAFCETAEKLSLEDWQDLIVQADQYSEEEGYRCALELVEKDRKFTAVIAGNDLIAVGAIRAIRSRGLTCPDAVSVTGFNDIPFMDRLEPSLTTVKIQGYEAGRHAAQLLLDKIENAEDEPNPVHSVLPVGLVIRDSTAAPPPDSRSSSRHRSRAIF